MITRIALLVAAALVLAGCGEDAKPSKASSAKDDPSPSRADDTAPLTEDEQNDVLEFAVNASTMRLAQMEIESGGEPSASSLELGQSIMHIVENAYIPAELVKERPCAEYEHNSDPRFLRDGIEDIHADLVAITASGETDMEGARDLLASALADAEECYG